MQNEYPGMPRRSLAIVEDKAAPDPDVVYCIRAIKLQFSRLYNVQARAAYYHEGGQSRLHVTVPPAFRDTDAAITRDVLRNQFGPRAFWDERLDEPNGHYALDICEPPAKLAQRLKIRGIAIEQMLNAS